jgi:hypothetical protein
MDDAKVMTVCKRDVHRLARHRILTAMDEIVAQFVFHAECLQRFDTAAPTLIAGQVTDRVAAVALALTQYQAGKYETAAALAASVNSDIRGI